MHCRMVSSGLVTVWPTTRGCVKISKSLPPCDAQLSRKVRTEFYVPIDSTEGKVILETVAASHYLESLVTEEVDLVIVTLLQEPQAVCLIPSLPCGTSRIRHCVNGVE